LKKKAGHKTVDLLIGWCRHHPLNRYLTTTVPPIYLYFLSCIYLYLRTYLIGEGFCKLEENIKTKNKQKEEKNKNFFGIKHPKKFGFFQILRC
jgi:hypothetical protein